ncbi:MAG: DUF2071 domain-containing protein [Verrucomicrobia bacterium]|nr:DUF2071 domain-containing protein [Verrucomicrobiota bacterium]
MRYLLQRHPLPMKAWFRHSLVLTYAVPAELLTSLLLPGLILDTFEGFGFVAVAMVQTCNLRPAFLPRAFGQDFFLTGYRVFTRLRTAEGRLLRGLRILRSDTDRRKMVWGGNLLTHYQYRLAKVAVSETAESLRIVITTPQAEADVEVIARFDAPMTEPPAGSPFHYLHQARLFAGPLPFTFDYEKETNSIIAIEGVRENWKPVPVPVEVRRLSFLDHPPFNRTHTVLANAFYVRDISCEWKRGVRHPLPAMP